MVATLTKIYKARGTSQDAKAAMTTAGKDKIVANFAALIASLDIPAVRAMYATDKYGPQVG